MVETIIQFDPGERVDTVLESHLRDTLESAGVALDDGQLDGKPGTDDPSERYALSLAQAALALQRHAGHTVEQAAAISEPGRSRSIALVEHEDSITGMAAVKLVIDLVCDPQGFDPAALSQFYDLARTRALSRQTAAIIRALDERGIPWLQPEREPLSGKMRLQARLRPNSLLMVGQGAQCQLIDSTFCVGRANDEIRAMLQDRARRRDFLKKMDLPLSDIGEDVEQANPDYFVLAINGNVWTSTRDDDGRHRPGAGIDDATVRTALQLSSQLGDWPVCIHIKSPSTEATLDDPDTRFVDFDLAPDLEALLGGLENRLALDKAAGCFVDWFFPDPKSASVPVIAVTGTNGKTSTSRMAAHILAHAGHKPGLVCTDGIFLDGKPVSKGDGSAFIGHARVLTSRAIDAAVLESHHRGIAVRGFAFKQCDVAVCLNVTSEHLAPGQIETLEEMAGVKRALAERGRCVVLNADNQPCLDMLPGLKPERLCLYSSTQDKAGLSDYSSAGVMLCITEVRDDEEWIVVYEHGAARPILRVSDMPCSFDGAARFLLENAQAAIAAALMAGVRVDLVAEAMKTFSMSFHNTPGRLNVYRDLPFTAVIDYAHNPDGMSRLVEFTNALPVAGRRILLLAGTGSRTDEIITDIARAAAGHFDHYVCRSYPRLRGRPVGAVPRIIRESLLEAGIPASAMTVCDDGHEARDMILGMAQQGDLVVMQLSSTEFSDVHKQLSAMNGSAL